MDYLGPVLVFIAAVMLIAALIVMIRGPKRGSAGQRGFWVFVIFCIPIFGPLLYLSRASGNARS